MYKIKDIAKRSSALLGVASLLAGLGINAIPSLASADSLNPLTKRSLTLSSASPGWSYTDGSGNHYNGTKTAGYSLYAAPNAGSNGQKTGETLDFQVSSADTVKAMSFQFCTASAGQCTAPGNDGVIGSPHHDIRDDTQGTKSNFRITPTGTADTGDTTGYPAAVNGDAVPSTWKEGEYSTIQSLDGKVPAPDGGLVANTSVLANALDEGTDGYGAPAANVGGGTGDSATPVPIPGQYVVLLSTDNGASFTQSHDWNLTVSNLENGTGQTGENNFAVLSQPNGVVFSAGEEIKVVFYGTYGGYFTNPGAGAFYAKINTYNDYTEEDANYNDAAPAQNIDFPSIASVDPTITDSGAPVHVIDGGVTVANVMNESIDIQTKVLETMDFSVGTIDPDTLDTAELTAAGVTRGTCNNILPALHPATDPHNVLIMGNSEAENSLDTDHTYATHSYFRLSSNSSNGASVYYTGVTLSDTEGDQINPMGWDPDNPTVAPTAETPSNGSEQFGLALDNGTTGDFGVDYSWAPAVAGSPSVDVETGADGGTHSLGALDTFGIASTGTGTGTVSLVNATPDVVGSGTAFTTELTPGGTITVDGTTYTVLSITDATHLTLSTNASADETAKTFTYTNPATSWSAYQAAHSTAVHNPQLAPLAPLNGTSPGTTDYSDGGGDINGTPTSKFAFDGQSNTVPALLATENTAVVDCVTGKVRYVANVSATTPAGIYTTKINYVAAPQY